MSQTPHFATQVPDSRRAAQLLADAAKLPALVEQLKHNRHSMCIPAQADDYDLLLTRIADLVPLVMQKAEAVELYARAQDLKAQTVLDAVMAPLASFDEIKALQS